MVRAPISYYGGKGKIYPFIISLFPPHEIYVEPFGGAASVLLNKPPSRVEVYNDLDGELTNLFRVLRDNGGELRRKLQLTLYSREEFALCLTSDNGDGPVEQARKTVVRFRQGFRGIGKTPGDWGCSTDYNQARKWRSCIDESLPEIIDRFRQVQIENLDAFDLIPRYDTPETLFYCDPPYPPETREQRHRHDYPHEMTASQHEELLTLLQSVEGMVVLSSYHSPLYDESLSDWRVFEKEVPCHASGIARTRKGKGGQAPRRLEVVWLNPQAWERRVQNVREFWRK